MSPHFAFYRHQTSTLRIAPTLRGFDSGLLNSGSQFAGLFSLTQLLKNLT